MEKQGFTTEEQRAESSGEKGNSTTQAGNSLDTEGEGGKAVPGGKIKRMGSTEERDVRRFQIKRHAS